MTNHEGPGITRRRLLAGAAGGLALALTGGRLWSPAEEAAAETGDQPAAQPLITHVARPLDAETPSQVFTQYLTPNDQFFIRSHFGPPAPALVAPASWRLSVAGLVERPLSLSLDDLSKFEEVSMTAVVQCSGNGRAFHRPKAPGVQWETGAVGNARWTGIRLRDVLQRAGLKARAQHLQLQGADRPVVASVPLFVRSIPLKKALHPDTILATRMNGAPLPLLHGAPLRLITPGWMADSCVKWLTDLTLQAEEARGYYMETAYRYPSRPVKPGEVLAPEDLKPVEAMVVKSLIAFPKQGATLSSSAVMVQGVAWTGEGHIEKVEVSTDEGKTWEQARLVGEDVPYAWRQWQFLWRTKGSGQRTILSRASDDRGQVQPMSSPWNPGGFLWNGVDRVQVQVTEA
ncbi:MAG: sulfite oxidase-like oxidoreductase [Nitrospirae bacterium]|nr:MAG: sulfite oxidase-like oxidoreductase [Nitrospirota bacterium]